MQAEDGILGIQATGVMRCGRVTVGQEWGRGGMGTELGRGGKSTKPARGGKI